MSLQEQLMTIEEVAFELGLHPTTITRMIKRGDLKAVRIGKRFRILKKEFERYTSLEFDPEQN